MSGARDIVVIAISEETDEAMQWLVGVDPDMNIEENFGQIVQTVLQTLDDPEDFAERFGQKIGFGFRDADPVEDADLILDYQKKISSLH